ncbi:hypothetical protein SDC9_86655 [bioreactor metagenome]|uniref:Uncharacterized protein n=1 Tax=bioreactor metagenome TaxID=1076179 RepID=A0A644ZH23_9ZZZZ
MVIKHHAFPLTTSQFIVIIVGKTFIFLHQKFNGSRIAQRSAIVYHCHTGTGNSRIIDQLIESILCFCRNFLLQRITSEHKRLPQIVGPHHFFHIEYARILYFCLSPKIVFAVFTDNISNLTRILLSKDALCKFFLIGFLITRLNGIRIPCILHDKVNRHFLGFEITNIDNPDAVESCLISQI